jgi:hypothetical protein
LRVSIVPVDDICERCRVLVDALREATDELATATRRMAALAGSGQLEKFYVAQLTVGALKTECQSLADELERHQAGHHSSTQL